ncbi:MAG: PD-(D/E)XK nuclease family protein [Sulfurimonas sp.]|nr:PD-(D/E)XK nuclease family protein [Sulfurimonas sp.]
MQQTTDFESFYMSDEFAKIDSYTKQFDLFEIMKVSRKELIHSDIIASLLNPNGSHKMGHTFVNMFIKALNVEKEGCQGMPFSLSTIISAINSNVRVFRERYNIDILLVFMDIKLVIAIENKIDAGEQDNQIKRYQECLEEKYPDYKQALVFLTIDGRAPSTADDNIKIPIYLMTYKTISKISELSRKSACPAAQFFLEQFIIHLENHMNGNQEIYELCNQIFKKHREVCKHIKDNYERCVIENISNLFNRIEHEIKKDPSLLTKLKIVKEKNRFDLDVRRDSWPEGINVKIYKHHWLGVFPFVDDKNKNLISSLCNHDPIPVESWQGYYYFSNNNNKDLDKSRWVRELGDEMEEEDIQNVLTKLETFIKEIDSTMNAK